MKPTSDERENRVALEREIHIRRLSLHSVEGDLEPGDGAEAWEKAVMINLGSGGSAFKTRVTPKVGEQLVCRWFTADELETNDLAVEDTQATVTWAKTGTANDQNTVGIRFDNPDLGKALKRALQIDERSINVESAAVDLPPDPSKSRLFMVGIGTPIEGEIVRESDGTLVFEQSLPLLRLGRKANLKTTDQKEHLVEIAAVDVFLREGTPKLCLTLSRTTVAALPVAQTLRSVSTIPAPVGMLVPPPPTHIAPALAFETWPEASPTLVDLSNAERFDDVPMPASTRTKAPPTLGWQSQVQKIYADVLVQCLTLFAKLKSILQGWQAQLFPAAPRRTTSRYQRVGTSNTRLTQQGNSGVLTGLQWRALSKRNRLFLIAGGLAAVTTVVALAASGDPEPSIVTLPEQATGPVSQTSDVSVLPVDPTVAVQAPAAPDLLQQNAPSPAVWAQNNVVLPSGSSEPPSTLSAGVSLEDHTGLGSSTGTLPTRQVDTFGSPTVPGGRSFLLRMSGPVTMLHGAAANDGFTVVVPGCLSLDRAGPIAQSHSGILESRIVNRGDRAELMIRFVTGKHPLYRVTAKGSAIEVTLGPSAS